MDEPTSASGSALLLIDFQQDFLADDGRMPVARHQVEPVLRATLAAVGRARDSGAVIIKIGNQFKVRDVLGNALRHHAAVAGSDGARWDPRFDADQAVFLPKWKPDAFCNPALEQTLGAHDVTRVAIAGLFARACVTATARSAQARGYRVSVLADAIACRSDASRDAALGQLAKVGIDIERAGSGPDPTR